MTASPSPQPAPGTSTETVGALISAVVGFFSNRNVHKLGGTALAVWSLIEAHFGDMTVGAAYAALMHVTGGLKKLPD